jgi:sugar/nucleoside kinase (ribokinase family)
VPHAELLTVGEAFEDLIFLDLSRIPRPGEEVKTSRFVATVGGGAVITAVAAARLGIRCRVVSGVGAAARARLMAEGVTVADLRRAGEPHAITAALSTATNRSFVTFNGINDVLETRLPAALARERARHVHFAFHPRSCGRWQRIVHGLRETGVTTSWDFGWNEGLLDDRRFPQLIRALDYVFLNEQEAVLYARRRSLGAAFRVWSAAPMHVIVKLGARGCRWVGGKTDLAAPARRTRVIDTTGAGDAFNGGFLAARLRGFAPLASLDLGNRVGSASTRRAGGLDGLPVIHDLPAAFRSLST